VVCLREEVGGVCWRVFFGEMVVVYLCMLWFWCCLCCCIFVCVVVFSFILCSFFFSSCSGFYWVFVWFFSPFSHRVVWVFYISCGCRCGILVYIVSKICSFCCFADECFIVGIWILVKLCFRSWS
jgi:hypothetical protein